MKTARHITISALICALIVYSFPMFPPEDADRNTRIDLKDAVLSVRDFVRSAAEPGRLSQKAGNTFSTLEISAGLKTLIMPLDDTPCFSGSPIFLVSFFIFFLPFAFFSYIQEENHVFVSRNIYMDVPPS